MTAEPLSRQHRSKCVGLTVPVRYSSVPNAIRSDAAQEAPPDVARHSWRHIDSSDRHL
jgi:hypothetical protein